MTIHLPGTVCQGAALTMAPDTKRVSGPEAEISSSATSPVATCSEQQAEQGEHRQRAERRVADQMVGMGAPAQIGHDRARRIDESDEKRDQRPPTKPQTRRNSSSASAV